MKFICLSQFFWWQFDEGRADYDGEAKADDIIKFIKANQLPLVTEFNDEVRVTNHMTFFITLGFKGNVLNPAQTQGFSRELHW